jgi:predicted nucleic acid-binding protein
LGLKTFWDTNVFIYLMERDPGWHDRASALFKKHIEGADELVTSMLTLGELLAQPLRMGRSDQAERYIEFMTTTPRLHLVSFDRKAAEHYGLIRSLATIRQPDAIQLACAATSGSQVFITNDQRLWSAKVPGIERITGI